MPLVCYRFCRGLKGPPSCYLPFPRCHPNGAGVCVCECVSVCRTKIVELSQWGEESQVRVYVCVVPLGETEANSRKWIGMEDLARDSGVKMKEFLHTQRNSLSLSLTLHRGCRSLLLSASGCTLYLRHLGFTNTCSHTNTSLGYAQPHTHAPTST